MNETKDILTTQSSDMARASAEVQVCTLLAKTNPRDQLASLDRIINACTRPGLAETAVYQYARGGTDISGPSIRLAEAMAQQWGNIQFGIRELDNSDTECTLQAYCWDIETNTRREVTFTVAHERHTRKGSYKLTDPRDIYENKANYGARRLRACILAIIPGDVTEAAVNQCHVTLTANANTDPETIDKMINSFSDFGVSKKQIEKRIQRRSDAIQPAQMVSLKKIYASLRDGMSKSSDWFDDDSSDEVNDLLVGAHADNKGEIK